MRRNQKTTTTPKRAGPTRARAGDPKAKTSAPSLAPLRADLRRRRRNITVATLALCCGIFLPHAQADGQLAVQYGRASNDYSSYAFFGAIRPGDGAWHWDASYYRSREPLFDIEHETEDYDIGLSYRAPDLLSLGLSGGRYSGELLDIDRYALHLGLELDRLGSNWKKTEVRFRYEHSNYGSSQIDEIRRRTGRLANAELIREGYTYGLSQGFGTIGTLSLDYTDYQYNRDPRLLALAMGALRGRAPNLRQSLASLLDWSAETSFRWYVTPQVDMEFSYAVNETVILNERLDIYRLAPRFYLGRDTWLGIEYTRSRSEFGDTRDYGALELGHHF